MIGFRTKIRSIREIRGSNRFEARFRALGVFRGFMSAPVAVIDLGSNSIKVLVAARRDGQQVFYSLASDEVRGIIAALRRSLAPEPDWSALEEALILSDAGTATARVVIDEAKGLRDGDGTTRLRSVLLKALDDGANASPADVRDPSVILLVGVNGAGKTTTAAKLAARAQSAGGTPLLVAADTFRAAAIDQLRLLAEREQVPVIEGRPGGDPAAAIHDALTAARVRGLSPVIIDTAGRLQTKHGLMDELAMLKIELVGLKPDAADKFPSELSGGMVKRAALARALHPLPKRARSHRAIPVLPATAAL